MKKTIKAVCQKRSNRTEKIYDFGPETAEKARKFHESFLEYQPTPLVRLKELSKVLGVSDIYVKDESFRFGLNAFKVLGGSYAIGRFIAEKAGLDVQSLSSEKIMDPKVRERVGEMTFVTATDGNHGRGVAWTAKRLGQKSVVYLPKGSAKERLDNIRMLGADACITEFNYDEAVRFAQIQAKKNGWVMVQDTSWEGYEKIPRWIMEGYTTMAAEIVQQLDNIRPTHIFLQAGVGAMAGALTGYFSTVYEEEKCPVIIIAEPDRADCLYRSADAGDGAIHPVTGDLDSIMAGLCCGEPCTIGWEILRDQVDCFVSMPDYVAAKGMRILGNPAGQDKRIISGESGAATVGLAAELMQNKELVHLRDVLGLGRDSVLLCVSTEGDTDKANYRRIVWDGAFSDCSY